MPSKRYKVAYAPIEDSDKTAHLRSLIRVCDGRSMDSQGSSVSIGGKLRLCSDCVDAQTDLNVCCMHMPTCTCSWIPALLLLMPQSGTTTSKFHCVLMINRIV